MTNEERREAVARLLKNAPDVLTPREVAMWSRYGRNTVYAMLKNGTLTGYVFRGSDVQVAELLGYNLGSVQRWLNNEHLQAAKAHGVWCIPKRWLADFCCHYGYRIVKKSEKHMELENEFFK